nr:putative ribonuclease H-like domain-containing protein [Tanacetum cinerariifolium]
RKNRTLIEAARTMLADSLLPIPFWDEAVNTACYVQNRVLVTKPHNKTPYELLHGRTPSIGFIRPFGCLVTIFNTLDSLGKFNGKVDEGFLGRYSEPEFEGKKPESEVNVSPSSKFEDFFDNSINEDNAVGTLVPAVGQLFPNSTNTFSVAGPSNAAASPTHRKSSCIDTFQLPDDPDMPELEDITYSDNEDDLATQTRSMTRVARNQGGLSQINNDDFHTCMFACFLSQEEPKRVHQALKDPSWIEAMKEELLQFKIQKVWVLVDLPHGKRSIGTKWVFRNKKDERGIVVKNKARLVAQGHTQEERTDYEEVFSPVVRIEAIRLFLAYASFMGFMVYQMDVKNAFLYGTIEEEVYVCQPPGFEDLDYPDKVYKVVKALYGLHQAPRAWKKGDILLGQIYVDDIIFGSTNKDLCKAFEKLMKDKFQMSLMGGLTFFLGLQVKQKKDEIFISQDKYVAEILKKFRLTDRKLVSTPIDTEKPLLKDPDGEDVDVHTYRSMIGSLMYLTSSRPDIMFAVYACAHFQVTPKASYLHAVKKIFRYLKGKPHLGLWYPKDSPFDLVAYSDSDYAGASLNMKSTTGGVNTPRCDEDRLELIELTIFLLPIDEKVRIEVSAVDLQVSAVRLILLLLVQKFLLFGLTNWCCSLNVVRSQTRMGYEKPSTKLTFYKAFFSSQWKFLIHTILQCMSAKRTSWNEFSLSMVAEGDDDEMHVEDVNAAEGVVSAVDDVVPTTDDEPSIPSPIPPTPPPQPSQDQPSTSQIAQALEITKLKQMVKKLERRNKLKVLKLRILKKVGSTQRIDTSDDTVMDDVSKHDGIIANIDADEDVVLEDAKDVIADAKDGQDADIDESADIQGRTAESQAQIYQIDLEHANKIITEVFTAASDIIIAASTTITAVDVLIPATTTATAPTLTTALSRRRKGVVIRDPQETAPTPSTIIHSEAKSKDKGKEILRKQKEDKAVKRYQALKRKPQTEAQARKNMMLYLKNVSGFKMDYFKGMTYDDIHPIFEKHFDSNVAFLLKTKEHMDEEDSRALKRLNESQEEKAAKKQKLDEEVEELKRHLQIVPNDEDDVYTEATPLARKIITFTTTQLILLVERRYPLIRFTLDQMLKNVRFEVEEESEVSLELLRIIKQQHQEGAQLE